MDKEDVEKIDILKQRKKEIDLEIKKIQNKRKNGNNDPNIHIRVSCKFNNEIEDIIRKRIEQGKDDDILSRPRITELIVRHKSFPQIKQDIIDFDIEVEKKKEMIKC